MNSITDWLNDSLKEIKHKEFENVIEIENAESEATGDGQVVVISDIKRVSLTLKTSNGDKKTLKTIAKLEASTNAGRDFAALCGAFTVEIKIYKDVLKSMEELMMEVEDDQVLWADCYLSGDNKLLFQDLCEIGYKVVPTYKFLDLNHSLLVMKALGKFHGLSLVLKERSKLDAEFFKTPYYARRLPFMDVMQTNILKKLAGSIRDSWGPEWQSVPDRILKYLDQPSEVLFNAWEASNGKWDVLNHGDFSMRNMLFHYGPDSDKPDAIKFVDFQMCHYSNLANDLIMLLYSSMRPQTREENMDTLLNAYKDSFSSTVKRYGYSGPIPTIQDIKSSICLLRPLVVTQLIFNIPMFVASGKLDLQEKADEYFQKYESTEEALKNPDDSMSHINFADPDVEEYLKYDFQRCMDENIF